MDPASMSGPNAHGLAVPPGVASAEIYRASPEIRRGRRSSIPNSYSKPLEKRKSRSQYSETDRRPGVKPMFSEQLNLLPGKCFDHLVLLSKTLAWYMECVNATEDQFKISTGKQKERELFSSFRDIMSLLPDSGSFLGKQSLTSTSEDGYRQLFAMPGLKPMARVDSILEVDEGSGNSRSHESGGLLWHGDALKEDRDLGSLKTDDTLSIAADYLTSLLEADTAPVSNATRQMSREILKTLSGVGRVDSLSNSSESRSLLARRASTEEIMSNSGLPVIEKLRSQSLAPSLEGLNLTVGSRMDSVDIGTPIGTPLTEEMEAPPKTIQSSHVTSSDGGDTECAADELPDVDEIGDSDKLVQDAGSLSATISGEKFTPKLFHSGQTPEDLKEEMEASSPRKMKVVALGFQKRAKVRSQSEVAEEDCTEDVKAPAPTKSRGLSHNSHFTLVQAPTKSRTNTHEDMNVAGDIFAGASSPSSSAGTSNGDKVFSLREGLPGNMRRYRTRSKTSSLDALDLDLRPPSRYSSPHHGVADEGDIESKHLGCPVFSKKGYTTAGVRFESSLSSEASGEEDRTYLGRPFHMRRYTEGNAFEWLSQGIEKSRRQERVGSDWSTTSAESERPCYTHPVSASAMSLGAVSEERENLVADFAFFISQFDDIHSIEQIGLAALRCAECLVEVPKSGLYLLDPKDGKLNITACKGFTDEEKEEALRTAWERHPGKVMREKTMYHVKDTAADVKLNQETSKRAWTVRSRLWLPVTRKDEQGIVECFGAFGFASEEPGYFTDVHIKTLEIVINLVSLSYTALCARQRVFTALEKFTAPPVSRSIAAMGKNSDMDLGGKTIRATVLFADIRNFTTLTEMQDPADIVKSLNDYFTLTAEPIFGNGGFLDKYIGDAQMALFGVPDRGPDDTIRACRAALGVVKAAEKYRNEGGARFFTGIGLSTGDVLAGQLGCSRFMSYTVIGDTVNLSSRLESLSKYYGVSILVSRLTYSAAKNSFFFVELDKVRVAGKNKPTRIYHLVAERVQDVDGELLLAVRHYTCGYASYRQGSFGEALKYFELSKDGGYGPAVVMMSRCISLQMYPEPKPGEWSGAWDMTQK